MGGWTARWISLWITVWISVWMNGLWGADLMRCPCTQDVGKSAPARGYEAFHVKQICCRNSELIHSCSC
jgi:hypothetical protein